MKKYVKAIIIGTTTLILTTTLNDISFAAETYERPPELDPIFAYIDWLIWLFRVIVSSIIGLIATFAGYKWSTDLSPSGVSEAKKILKNCAVGLFYVQFGATIANYFVDKLQSFL